MLSLLIAGGVMLAAPQATTEPELTNATLLREYVLAKQVVTRNQWGTPMLPDGKGGYSVIQKSNSDYIRMSLVQPPVTSGEIFRPSTAVIGNIEIAPSLPTP